jgi:hypothetical protein
MRNLSPFLVLVVLLAFPGGCDFGPRVPVDRATVEVKNTDAAAGNSFEESASPSYDYEISDQHPSASNMRSILSLRNLISQLEKRNSSKKEVPELSKLGWIEGYVVDKANDDILFFGRENSNWPDLFVDDLLYLRKNVLDSAIPPYCSLDPIPENVKEFNKAAGTQYKNESFAAYYNRLKQKWGNQKVVVGGTPGNSNIAYVMLEADYHMKKVSQGLVTVPPIQSLIDIHMNAGSKKPNQSNMSRFWFKCETSSPRFQHEENIVMLDACDVIVLTEAQGTTGDGRLFDSGETNEESEMFADNLSRNFRIAATQVEVYAQLENLYRLLALMNAMKLQGHLQDHNNLFNSVASSSPYVREFKIPATYPGLTNAKTSTEEFTQENGTLISEKLYFVCGGVDMSTPVSNEKMRKGGNELTKLRDQILASRSDQNVSWSLPVNFVTNAPQTNRRKKDKNTGKKPGPYDFENIPLPEEWQLPRK